MTIYLMWFCILTLILLSRRADRDMRRKEEALLDKIFSGGQPLGPHLSEEEIKAWLEDRDSDFRTEKEIGEHARLCDPCGDRLIESMGQE